MTWHPLMLDVIPFPQEPQLYREWKVMGAGCCTGGCSRSTVRLLCTRLLGRHPRVKITQGVKLCGELPCARHCAKYATYVRGVREKMYIIFFFFF